MRRPFQKLTACFLGASIVLAACGGQTDGSSSSRADASVDGDVGPWTACASPHGYRIAGGPNNCSDTCGGYFPSAPDTLPHPVGFCINAPWNDFRETHMGKSWEGVPDGKCNGSCEDGVCVGAPSPSNPSLNPVDWSFACAPYEIGVLYARSGAADRVRYADFGLWQDKPIPASAGACPTVPGMTLCGPGCGTCAPSELCVGRAPLHPTGFCVPRQPDQYHPTSCSGSTVMQGCNAAWSKCFRFTVEPAAQALADEYGYCVPNSSCAQLAASLPGGGKCSP